MPPPAVLLIDPEGSRRKELARGLSGFGYEVVPAMDGDEGMRFAAGLAPGIVVAPAAVAWWDPLESTCRHASLSIL